MSVSYPADPTKPYGDRIESADADALHNEPFVPVYARRGKARGGQGQVRTWMILAPVAVLVLGGIGAIMVLSSPSDADAPLVEPARTAPVFQVRPTETAVASVTGLSTPEPVIGPSPVIRDTAALRPAAPASARREPTRAPTPAAVTASTLRSATPTAVAQTGPQPYTPPQAQPRPNALPTALAPATPATSPQPRIVIAPEG